jgi:hypothetical protein
MPTALLALLLFLTRFAVAKAEDYLYDTDAGGITITGYTGPGGALSIPGAINGLAVTSIADSAFARLDRLVSVLIPDGVSSISGNAFSDCTGLTNIVLGAGVASIGAGAFSGCTDLASITLGNGVTDVGDFAFGNCDSLKAIVIPEGVIRIGYGAFSGCNTLTNVTIPDSVISIGDNLFLGCTHLVRVTIGNGVSDLGRDVFSGCTRLAIITVAPQNAAYSSLDGVLFNQNRTTLIAYPAGKAAGEAYTVPDSVTSVGAAAFLGCEGLIRVTVGNSVTTGPMARSAS